MLAKAGLTSHKRTTNFFSSELAHHLVCSYAVSRFLQLLFLFFCIPEWGRPSRLKSCLYWSLCSWLRSWPSEAARAPSVWAGPLSAVDTAGAVALPIRGNSNDLTGHEVSQEI